ncbi:GDT1-like protein 5 isoform X2 [Actinidia eriantha]|uniref:GDT1-like protein 5 isoform X2 n=1 Tax=Actinidia eriantha TaxID=165200 RepID=UPI00258AF644|nr:GDT1-like protein 5 isoform X2 [Actinidia eriantha]
MSLPVLQGGFTKSLAITVLSEVGDRTFCVAAILAMRYPRRSVLFGCLSSVIVTTILSALVGKAAPNLANDNFKKRNWPFLTHFFSPVFLKAFSVTFFGEWGDKSQLATIGLAADGDALAVILGGITGQTLCTIAAVIGGKSLASRISERLVTLMGGVLFLLFGLLSFFSPVVDE